VSKSVSDFPAWGEKFCRLYVDTGNLLKALEGVKVSPSEFYDAKAQCPQFADHMKGVTRRANETLRLRAFSASLDGSDKLLALAMKTLEDDEENMSKLTDAQLEARIVTFMNRIRERSEAAQNGPNDSLINGVKPT